jgi:hypothetical protein
MTIVASVKVRDGLILGTDSMTQIWGAAEEGSEAQLWKHYTNARKLFQLRDFPMGVMTYGVGNIGNRSIEGVVFDFSKTLAGNPSVPEAAQGLFDYTKALYEEAFGQTDNGNRPVLGIFVAGYSPNQVFSDQYEFVLPRDEEPTEVAPPESFGAVWRGIDSPYTRLAVGIDPSLIPRVAEKGFTDEELQAMLARVRMTVVFDGMPLQDAINYCAYILDTTIGWAAFQWGPQTCGRPLQVATILEASGFQWISKPDLSIPA